MGAERLPPDQVATRKWPVVGERAPSPEGLDLEAWRLTVGGLVEAPRSYTLAEIRSLGTRTLTADLHCVTRWSRFGMAFGGLPLSDLLEAARPLPEATYVRFVAYSERHHDTGLPLDVARRDTWLVHSAEGAPLTVEHGAPLRTLTVGRYLYKSLKWVRAIELLPAPALGYWEREDGYHEGADPWPGTQRYATGSVPPEVLARFRAATDFSPFRGKTVRGLDLRRWRPATTDLSRLALKDCDFRGADLSGCDLRGANLTMGNFRGARLDGADLTGADLEGAFLAGANLRGADLGLTYLTGASFFDGPEGAPEDLADVTGARFEGAMGLLEGPLTWLVRQHASGLGDFTGSTS